MASPQRGAAASGWKTYEILDRDGTGEFTVAPVSDALRFHAPQARPAVAKMQKVEEIGWPLARTQLSVPGRHGKRPHAIVRPDDKDPPIWELKCTPHAWRLFFFVWEKSDDKRLIYLHATYKKTTDQDSGEVVTARTRHGRVCTGDSATQEFEFPD